MNKILHDDLWYYLCRTFLKAHDLSKLRILNKECYQYFNSNEWWKLQFIMHTNVILESPVNVNFEKLDSWKDTWFSWKAMWTQWKEIDNPTNLTLNYIKARKDGKTNIASAAIALSSKIDTCAICKNLLYNKCARCLHEASCFVTIGKCWHFFHYHCIETWLAIRDVCPLDNKTWECKFVVI